jgi:hypothetical protein
LLHWHLTLSENKLNDRDNITTTCFNPKWHGLIFTKTGMGGLEGVWVGAAWIPPPLISKR